MCMVVWPCASSQLMLELRTITWYMATRQPHRIGLDKVPSAAFVEGLLADCGKEKRDAAKKREHTDGEALIKSGKWLTQQVLVICHYLQLSFIDTGFSSCSLSLCVYCAYRIKLH